MPSSLRTRTVHVLAGVRGAVCVGVLCACLPNALRAAPPKAEQLQSLPDIFGPGAVLRAGAVHMKVTNYGHVGNIFTNLSSDPAGQWPEESGIEYLNSIRLAVGAKDTATSDTARMRRVSYLFNWRPASLDPEDRIYSARESSISGARFFNDDGDMDLITQRPRADEDFLDGHDNDGDGLIDEDYAAVGDQMYSLVMRDDTAEAMEADSSYLPLGLECRQIAWAYSRPDFGDMAVVEYTIINRSDHALDSVYVGWATDLDCGPVDVNYFTDDRDVPGFPSGEFTVVLPGSDSRRQHPHANPAATFVPADSALCPRLTFRVNGYSVADDDGDGGRTRGLASFLLIDHTVDPRGIAAPARTGFRAFRSFIGGTPYPIGGNPLTPAERYEFMSSTEHVDATTGFVNAPPGSSSGDYVQWCSIGPFRDLPPGGSVQATIAFAVQAGSLAEAAGYGTDYASYRAGTLSPLALLGRYPLLRVGYDAQLLFEGRYEPNEFYPAPDFHGRETALQLALGDTVPNYQADCRDLALGRLRPVTDREPTWFDFDCDYCTGVWDFGLQRGLFHRTWERLSPLFLGVGAPPSHGASVWLASANPARGDVRIAMDLPAAATVRLAMYDVVGRRLRHFPAAALGAGRAELRWDLRDDSGARVRPGLHFFRAEIAGMITTGRFIVLQ